MSLSICVNYKGMDYFAAVMVLADAPYTKGVFRNYIRNTVGLKTAHVKVGFSVELKSERGRISERY